MKQRLITAAIAAALFIPFLIFSDTPAFTVCFLLLTLVATYEMLGCIGFRKNIPISALSYIYTGAAIILTRVLESDRFLVYIALSSLIYVMCLMSVSLFSHGIVAIDHVSEVFMMMFYIALTFSCVILVRDSENGAYVYLLVFLSAWISDSGAYFTGMAMGKHKLIPDVSPKKTVEGAVGGIIICVIFMMLYAFIISMFTDLEPIYPVFALGAIVLSVASMIGDLFASLMKRRHEIKDYGFIFPGHGGVLDRFDSVLATAPILMIIVTLFGFYR